MLLEIILGLMALLALAYYFVTRNHDYFKNRGIPHEPPSFPFGSKATADIFLARYGFAEALIHLYEKSVQHKVYGYYSIADPIFLINDMDLIKNVLIKDFDYFMDRRSMAMSDSSLADRVGKRMLTFLEGEEWKVMRAKMSPVFTSGKLKNMTDMLNHIGDKFVQHLDKLAEDKKEFNAKEVMSLYTLDTIMSCGFGVESDSFKKEDNEMSRMVKRISQPGLQQFITLIAIMISPDLAKALRLSFFDKQSTEFFYHIIKKTLTERERTGVRRNDFVDYILDALKDIDTEDEDKTQFEADAEVKTTKALKLSPEELERDLLANALLFFIAGFDNGSTVMSIIMLFLAKDPDTQERVYNEIRDAMDESPTGTLDYTTAQSLPLLDACIHEMLRFYPIGLLERKCVKDYKVPGTDIVIEKDKLVQIATSGIMRNKEYFPHPDEYNLDNFSPEAKAKRGPYAYFGFGLGPRNCIGMRFALLQVKYSLIRLLYNFKIVEGPNTPKEVVIDPKSLQGQNKGGTVVMVEKRE